MAKPYAYRCVMIGQGAGPDPKTIAAGTTGQALRVATTGDEPTFGTLDAATVLGTTKVPAANGGTALDTSASTGVAQVAAGVWSVSAVDLATADVTGILPLANGGTASAVGPLAPFGPFYGTAVGAGATVFLGRDEDATESSVQFSWPVSGSVVRMDSRGQGGPVGAETFIYTLRVGAADTALTHTVTGTDNSGSGTAAVAVTAGSRGSIKLVTSAGAAVVNHIVTLAMRVTG